jgi:hypothetical protein
MKISAGLVGALFLFHVVTSVAEASRPRVYLPPRSLDVEIASKPDGDPRSFAVLTGTLKSLTGNLTQMKVHFESSEDLDVSPKTAPLESLAQGAIKVFELTVTKTGSVPGVSGSWVRVRVEFLPDYGAIMEAVEKDQKAYPMESSRNQLLKSLEYSKTRAVKSVQAKGFLFPSQSKAK